MKKLLFLLIFIFLTLGGVNTKAQIVKSISLRTGVASTFPTVKETQNGRRVNDGIYIRNMLYPELQVELFPYKHFSLNANVAYISKGFNRYERGSGGLIPTSGGIVAENVDYFTVLTAPKFSRELTKVTLYGFLGPYLGFRNAYDAYYVQGLNFMPDYYEVQVLKPRTWGGTLGGGIEFKSKNKAFHYSVQAQYMQDLTKAVDFNYNYTDRYGNNWNYLFKAKFQTLLLSFGVHYAFKKNSLIPVTTEA